MESNNFCFLWIIIPMAFNLKKKKDKNLKKKNQKKRKFKNLKIKNIKNLNIKIYLPARKAQK